MTGFTVPTTEPDNLYAGDVWQWTKQLSDYPNATYVLKYSLDGASTVADITATSTPNTDTNYTVSLAATTTATILPGTYKWIARVTAGTDIHTVLEGVFLVLPNRATTTAAQTHNEKMLAAIEALLEGRVVTGYDNESYQIGGRALNKVPFEQLWRFRGVYRIAVWRERNLLRANPSIDVNFGGINPVPLGIWRP